MTSESALGFYGMAVAGLDAATNLMHPVQAGWPTLRVIRELGEPELVGSYQDADIARYRLESARGDVYLDRAAMTARFVMETEHDDQSFVHPFMGIATAMFTWWMGRDGFHAGAFVNGAGAWAVLGEREAGKSTLMAQLHLSGMQILTDDIVVLDNGNVLPGPACIDLREGAAQHLHAGEDLGVVGTRRRFRLTLPTGLTPVPLAGWVLPVWGESCAVTALPLTQRLPRVLANIALNQLPQDGERLLDLATLPCLVWQRPQDWNAMRVSVNSLIAATA